MAADLVITTELRGIKEIEKGLEGIAGSFEGFSQKIGGTVRSLAAFGAAAGAAFAGMLALGKQAVAAADQLGRMADAAGVGVEAFQRLDYAAKKTGVSQQQLGAALQRLSRGIAEAAQGGGALKGVLDDYGIAISDAEGRTRATEDVLRDLAGAMERAGSSQEQLRIATRAFGQEGANMALMLRDGADGLDEMMERADRLGIVLDEKTIRGAQSAEKAFIDLSAVVRVQLMRALLELLPAIESIGQTLSSDAFLGAVRTVGSALAAATAFVVKFHQEVLALAAGIVVARVALVGLTPPLAALAGLLAGAGVLAWQRFSDQASDTGDVLDDVAQTVREFEALLDGLGQSVGAAAVPVRTIADVVRDVRFETFIAGLGDAGEEAMRVARALGLIRDLAGDLDSALPNDLFSVAPGAEEDVLRLQRALQELEAARRAVSDEEARAADLDARAAEVRRQLQTATERYAIELSRLDELYQEGRISAEEFAAAVEKLNERFSETPKRLTGLAAGLEPLVRSFSDPWRDVGTAIGNAFKEAENALVDFVRTGKLSFSDLIDSIIEDLVRLAIRQAIMAPLLAAFGGGGAGYGGHAGAGAGYGDPNAGGPGAGGGLYAALGGMGGAALGYGAFTLGQKVFKGLSLFARGGAFGSGGKIIEGPSIFSYGGELGVAGEAGPEAIFPLSRGPGGELGVRAEGLGGGDVNITIVNQGQPLEVVGTRERPDASGQRTIELLVQNVVKRGFGQGAFDGAMSQRFDLRPRAR